MTQLVAPGGRLRAAINFGNPVLAQRDPHGGEPRGVSAALARELGRRLGVPVEFVPFDGAGQVVDAAARDAWDVAFLAVDPVRGEQLAFTSPYVVIEGTYLVRDDSPARAVGDLDRDGVRIAVGRGSAYDLFLTRTLARASIVRVATSAGAMDAFVEQRLDAAAGVKQPLTAYAAAHPGLRVIPGRFMAIEQAVALPKARAAALPYVQAFVEEMKRSAFVASALAQSGQTGATIAPPAA